MKTKSKEYALLKTLLRINPTITVGQAGRFFSALKTLQKGIKC